MIPRLRFTLLADGPSDRCLVPILSWVIRSAVIGDFSLDAQYADLRGRTPAPQGLSDRIRASFDDYPCQVLFVHRDAEAQDPSRRREEIGTAFAAAFAQASSSTPKYFAVVPIRMTEAWLLVDEQAIRQAADNSASDIPLGLPALKDLEAVPDPKEVLRGALVTASSKKGRRLGQFKKDLSQRVQRVADLIKDFSNLRRLSAFRQLEADVKNGLPGLL